MSSSSAPADGSLLFRDLGDLHVEVHGRPRSPGGRRPAALLAALLVHADRPVGVDLLSTAVWPDGVPRSTSTLESHLWRLRQVLEPDRVPGTASTVLRTEPGGYRLVVGIRQVDSLRFAALARDADRELAAGRPGDAAVLCEEARDLWRGRPFAAVADQPWAAPAVARLEELRSQLSERHVEALLESGRTDVALLELGTALAAHPLRERLWAHHMVASYRAGRVDEALAGYARARALLLEELGTEPGEELRETHRRVLAADPALRGPRSQAMVAARPEDPAPLRLPRWTTRLVDREPDVERLADLVRVASPVTLCGAAGVGKTRLAVETAHRVGRSFPDGVHFVDLVGTRDDGQVVDAVTSALGLAASPAGSATEALAVFLRDREVLLLLDDCEHVVDEVARLVDALGPAAPGVRLVVTSRQRLEVTTETVVELSPLTLPADDGAGGGALELFLDRWETGAGPTAADDLAHARRVCRAVEGVPLALELAAARARTFSLEEVADQSEQDPSALSGSGRRRRGPQPSVFAAVARSYDLLDDDGQRLHRALSVLPGPFTVDAAAAVTGASAGEVADLLADLTHRSLLTADRAPAPGRPTSFAQLTIVRAHAAHVLAGSDEDAAVRERRTRWILGLVVDDRPRLGAPAERRWSDALGDDLPTLRGVLHETLVERPSPLGVRIVAGLGTMFWYQRDATVEGRRWAERADEVSRCVDGAVPADVRVHLTTALATIHAFARRLDLAAPVCDRLLAGPGPDTGDLRAGDALVVLSLCLGLAGDTDRAGRVLDVVAGIVARTGDPTLDLHQRVRLGMSALGERDPRVVLAEMAALHADARAVDNRFAAWIASGVAHLAAMAAGDGEASLHWSDACLRAIERTGRQHAPFQLEQRAATLAMLGRYDEARRLYDAARVHVERAGMPWPTMPGTPALLERVRAATPDAPARVGDDVARLTVRDLLRTLRDRTSA